MTITQTVEIPASHRLTIDVPREVPEGTAVLAFTPKEKQVSEMDATEYLMSTPANREHLERAMKSKKYVSFETMEQLDECVREHGTARGEVLLQEARERGAKLAASGAFDKCNAVTPE